MRDKNTLTISDWELLGQAYTNLVEAGLVVATVDYDDFVEAVLTGDTFDYDSLKDKGYYKKGHYLMQKRGDSHMIVRHLTQEEKEAA